jgi:hypothetical protein
MRVTLASRRELDPEGMCTRVVARLIEEFACVCITPESPAWQDIEVDGRPVGELRVYRGRGRVQKIVSFKYELAAPAVRAHSMAVLTEPASPVPHLWLDFAHTGPQVSVSFDLLPKCDLGVSLAYLDRCYGPLTEVRADLDEDGRFTPLRVSRRLRSLLSPWSVAHAVDPSDLDAATFYLDRFVTHWASLLRSNAPELQPSPAFVERDAEQRKLLFSRGVDPAWDRLDALLGGATVDALLAALSIDPL